MSFQIHYTLKQFTLSIWYILTKFIILLSNSFYTYGIYLEWNMLENKASINILNLSFSHFLMLILGIGRRFSLHGSVLLLVYIFGKSFEGQRYWLCWLRLAWDNLWIRFPVVILNPCIFLSITQFYSEIPVDISQFTFSHIPKSLL